MSLEDQGTFNPSKFFKTLFHLNTNINHVAQNRTTYLITVKGISYPESDYGIISLLIYLLDSYFYTLPKNIPFQQLAFLWELTMPSSGDSQTCQPVPRV